MCWKKILKISMNKFVSREKQFRFKKLKEFPRKFTQKLHILKTFLLQINMLVGKCLEN